MPPGGSLSPSPRLEAGSQAIPGRRIKLLTVCFIAAATEAGTGLLGYARLQGVLEKVTASKPKRFQSPGVASEDVQAAPAWPSPIPVAGDPHWNPEHHPALPTA